MRFRELCALQRREAEIGAGEVHLTQIGAVENGADEMAAAQRPRDLYLIGVEAFDEILVRQDQPDRDQDDGP